MVSTNGEASFLLPCLSWMILGTALCLNIPLLCGLTTS